MAFTEMLPIRHLVWHQQALSAQWRLPMSNAKVTRKPQFLIWDEGSVSFKTYAGYYHCPHSALNTPFQTML